MVVDDFATVPTRCTLSCTLQERPSRHTGKPKPFRESVRVSGKPIWSMAKVASNISTSAPKTPSVGVGRGGEKYSCGERRADQGHCILRLPIGTDTLTRRSPQCDFSGVLRAGRGEVVLYLPEGSQTRQTLPKLFELGTSGFLYALNRNVKKVKALALGPLWR